MLDALQVESCAGVGDAKIHGRSPTREFNLGVRGMAMLHDIAQCFLDDAKHAKRHVRRDLRGNVAVNKLDLQIVLLRHFAA